MKTIAVLALFLLVVGCTTISEVAPLGEHRYLVGAQVRGGLTSWATVEGIAVKQATAFCTAKNMKIDVLHIATSGAQGWTPQNADVTFRCVN